MKQQVEGEMRGDTYVHEQFLNLRGDATVNMRNSLNDTHSTVQSPNDASAGFAWPANCRELRSQSVYPFCR